MKPIIQNVEEISNAVYGEEIRKPLYEALDRISDSMYKYQMMDAMPEMVRRYIGDDETHAITANGCTCTYYNEGSIRVSGTPSSATTYFNITGDGYTTTLPEWIGEAKQFYIYSEPYVSGINMRCNWYDANGDTLGAPYDSTYNGQLHIVTVPEEAHGLLMRIQVSTSFSGTTTTVRYHILTVPYKTLLALPQKLTEEDRVQIRENIDAACATTVEGYRTESMTDIAQECIDLLTPGLQKTHYGVTFTLLEDGWTRLEGTSTGSGFWNFYWTGSEGAPPPKMVKGQTYQVTFFARDYGENTGYGGMSVYSYIGSTQQPRVLYATASAPIKFFTYENEWTNILFRFNTANTYKYSGDIKVTIFPVGLNAVQTVYQSLNSVAKQIARENIEAAHTSEVLALSSQTLTTAQKQAVRNNIDAPGSSEVLHVTSQSLTEAQQKATRENIDAIGEDRYNDEVDIDVLNAEQSSYTSSVVNGVTYEPDTDGYWTITGTADSNGSWKSMISSSTTLPSYFVKGAPYYLDFNCGTVPIRVYWYVWNDGTTSSSYTDYSENTVITVPEKAVGVVIRFQISAGATVNETVKYTLQRVRHGWIDSRDVEKYYETNIIDTSDAINSLLESTGYCHLGPGVFYITKAIVMPEGSTLTGCGRSTVIRLTQDSTATYALKMQKFCTLTDLRLSGSLNENPVSTKGNRTGVLFTANYDGSLSGGAYTSTHCMMSNVTIDNFNANGMTCTNTSRNYAEGLNLVNCHISHCYTGLNIAYASEYSKYTNLVIDNCHTGCVNNGGNNMFVGCTFHATTIGFYIDGDATFNGSTVLNPGHGSAVGCTFNHIGNVANGVGSAITVKNVDQGFVFDGCQIWYGTIDLRSSYSIMFSGCEFGKSTDANNQEIGMKFNINGGTTVIAACVFHKDNTFAPDFSGVTSSAKLRMSGCYGGVTGNEITGS